ncbi:hypothetical protein [Agrobacterium larrymoorei]|uniref:Uncharacterized protein n=1 Tax=Agrobacterium larrymoorei TaxID=160699 RepID=A0AAF0KCD1_9HYPH|nr:hypothetical protein [Agrobacterium larrymoorei]WHA39733.1 hypothetical protein CFBP5477_007660 [Agrobacterium larrymoorei]
MNLDIVPHAIPDFQASDVLQIRHTVKRLELPEEFGAETTLQIGKVARYCTAMPATVASQVNLARESLGLPALVELILPGGKPVWLAGEKAQGPVRLIAGELVDGVHSAYFVGELLTRVRNTPEEVAAAIGAVGGQVLPIPELMF